MAAKLEVQFTANTSGFQKGISAVNASIKGLAGAVAAALAPLAGLITIGAALGATFKGISLAADLEATEAAFSTMLGSATKARQALEAITEVEKRGTFGMEDLAQAARGLLAVSDLGDLQSNLSMLGDIASVAQMNIKDLAAMYSKNLADDLMTAADLNQLTNALGGGFMAAMANELGVEGSRAVRVLGAEGKITGENLTNAFKAMTSAGGMAFGAMEAQAKTFNGLLSIIKKNWDGLLREFGAPIMLALKPMLEDAGNLLDSMKTKASEFGEIIARVITFWSNAWKEGQLFQTIGSILKVAAAEFINTILRGLMAAGAVLMNAFLAIGDLIGGIFTNEYTWAALYKRFEYLGVLIQSAVIGALPEFMIPDQAHRLTELDDDKRYLQSVISDLGSEAAKQNAAHFSGAKSSLGDSGKVFLNAFKNSPKLFDVSKDMEKIRRAWENTEIRGKSPDFEQDSKPDIPKNEEKAAQPAPVAQFAPILSSLARIGGASGLTSNPLVALQQTANNHLARIEANTSSAKTAVLA